MNGSSSRGPAVLTFKSVHPSTLEKDWPISLRLDDLKNRIRDRAFLAYQAKYLVRSTLENPGAIFEGVRWEQDEVGGSRSATANSRKSVCGKYCYVSTPGFDYDSKGNRINPPNGKVFLVFVDEDWYVYYFYWARCDPADVSLPHDYGERFRSLSHVFK